jgi:hypothetical protein
MAKGSDGWHGVDLDGTLAEYHGFKGTKEIGNPIPKMVARVKKWIKNGETVKIMTARANDGPAVIANIQDWLEKHGMPRLEVTSRKDHKMIDLWDDRAVQVVPNEGIPVWESLDGTS